MPVERHGVESGFGQGLAEARFQRPVSGLEIVLCAITGGDPGEACERIRDAERFIDSERLVKALFQPGEAAMRMDGPARGLHVAGNRRNQRGLATAIAPDKADPLGAG